MAEAQVPKAHKTSGNKQYRPKPNYNARAKSPNLKNPASRSTRRGGWMMETCEDLQRQDDPRCSASTLPSPPLKAAEPIPSTQTFRQNS
ncbi:hypothetical protein Bca4012_021403 [Brassica carinata]